MGLPRLEYLHMLTSPSGNQKATHRVLHRTSLLFSVKSIPNISQAKVHSLLELPVNR